jgi:hypothetical protein
MKEYSSVEETLIWGAATRDQDGENNPHRGGGKLKNGGLNPPGD